MVDPEQSSAGTRVTVPEAFAMALGAQRAGRLAEAERLYHQILKVNPGHIQSLVNLGVALQAQGRLGEAVVCYRRALTENPDLAVAHNNLADVLRLQGEAAESEASYRRALALDPALAAAHRGLGTLLAGRGAVAEAEACFRQAIAVQPDHPEAHNNLGVALQEQGKMAEAEAAYQRAIELRPAYSEACNNLGVVLARTERVEAAVAAYRRAIDITPDYAEAHNNLGVALQDQGHLDEAAASYRRAITLKGDHGGAYYNLAALKLLGRGTPQTEAAFAGLEAQIATVDRLEPRQAWQMLFAMGRALEDRGDYDQAFGCLARANAMRRAGLAFDVGAPEQFMAAIARTFDRPLLQRLEGLGATSRRPIFVVGMPRSGTTLVEQIISAHPAVHGAGELELLASLANNARGVGGAVFPAWASTMTRVDAQALAEAYLNGLPAAAEGSERVTDKWLYNFQNLGLIHAILPQAPIIHCRRDPRDVCFSAFAIRFSDGQDYAYDLTELGRYWRAYDALMDHWRAVLPPGRILEVPYEAVVEDLETWARRLIAHCGLPWDDACLRFHESGRQVRTASSAQVRRPIYTGSVGRWRRFEAHLGPLLAALGEPWAHGGPA